jgi:16S rRNA (cytosine1402-N4)-methyltransferase
MVFSHVSVLPREVVAYLAVRPGGIYVDGTIGGAGHAAAILELSGPDGRLIGFDRDPAALAAAAERLQGFGDRVTLIHGNFAGMQPQLTAIGIGQVHGVLLDLGVSSHQLDTPERGFSFQVDAPLDMRMNPTEGDSAVALVNEGSEEELTDIIFRYGEERWARRIAKFIVAARSEAPILSTGQLAAIISGAIPRKAQEERLHPATRTFQALRIAVNQELASLETLLGTTVDLLAPGGRMVVISFHSLEDRIVKESFRSFTGRCICPRSLPRCSCGARAQLKVLTSKPVTAAADEVAVNPRARSAKLRAVERLPEEAR